MRRFSSTPYPRFTTPPHVGRAVRRRKAHRGCPVASSEGSLPKGNFQVDENDLPNKIVSNVVIQDVHALQNPGGVVIRDNDIDGKLQSKENDPKPVGEGNIVEGNREDRCKRL